MEEQKVTFVRLAQNPEGSPYSHQCGCVLGWAPQKSELLTAVLDWVLKEAEKQSGSGGQKRAFAISEIIFEILRVLRSSQTVLGTAGKVAYIITPQGVYLSQDGQTLELTHRQYVLAILAWQEFVMGYLGEAFELDLNMASWIEEAG
jgi:hypothetical protein